MKKLNKNQKEKLYFYLYLISFWMLIGFCIKIVIEYIQYNPYEDSMPFMYIILIRGVEFIIPSIFIFILTNIIKYKNEKKENKDNKIEEE